MSDAVEKPEDDEGDDGDSEERSKRTEEVREDAEDAADDFERQPYHDEDEDESQEVLYVQFSARVREHDGQVCSRQ